MVVCRSESELLGDIRRKIALFASLPVEAIVSGATTSTTSARRGCIRAVRRRLHPPRALGLSAAPDLSGWEEVTGARARRPSGSQSRRRKRRQARGRCTCRSSRRSAMPAMMAAGSRSTGSIPSRSRSRRSRSLAEADGILIPAGSGGPRLRRQDPAAEIAREKKIRHPWHLPRHAGRGQRFARHAVEMEGELDRDDRDPVSGD